MAFDLILYVPVKDYCTNAIVKLCIKLLGIQLTF